MTTKDVIIQNIIIYEVLTRRKSILDQLIEGFQEAGILTSFSEDMEDLFVLKSGTGPTSQEIVAMIQYADDIGDNQQSMQLLKDYIYSLNEQGIAIIVIVFKTISHQNVIS